MSTKPTRASDLAVQTFTQSLAHVDRAILDGDTAGFVKVHVLAGTDKIVGATVVAKHAGEMISELSLALTGKLGLGKLGQTIHPYPTQAEALKKAGDAFFRTKLTPFAKWLLGLWLKWMGVLEALQGRQKYQAEPGALATPRATCVTPVANAPGSPNASSSQGKTTSRATPSKAASNWSPVLASEVPVNAYPLVPLVNR